VLVATVVTMAGNLLSLRRGGLQLAAFALVRFALAVNSRVAVPRPDHVSRGAWSSGRMLSNPLLSGLLKVRVNGTFATDRRRLTVARKHQGLVRQRQDPLS
jgi:hypothetical protein